MSLGGFSFGDLSNIFNSLNKLLHPVTSIMTPIMVELDKSLSSNGIYNVVKDFAIDFMLSSAGSYLLYTGVGMVLASPHLTVAVGIVAMGWVLELYCIIMVYLINLGTQHDGCILQQI